MLHSLLDVRHTLEMFSSKWIEAYSPSADQIFVVSSFEEMPIIFIINTTNIKHMHLPGTKLY